MYTIVYASIVTVIVAIALAFAHSSLEPQMLENEKLATQKDILRSVGLVDLPNTAEVYGKSITSVVIDANGKLVEGVPAETVSMAAEYKKPEADQIHPLFIYTADDGSKKYILPVFGNGLWDKIWGYVAIESDFNTIAGVSMDHKSETPGLGAEIKDNPEKYDDPFIGKSIYDSNNNYVSIRMVKGGIKEPEHEIDGISGATITSDGVNEMMERGIGYYLSYFETIKNQTSLK
ncbi:MAG: NADH:ubiquinone reductase (Na(+)-transporting) subunit C [Bacteroidetes bacterium]|nr:NADH:ubiquinone reductase (Na(+)-transporting) subunit C [Bacteroidota bacterium]MBP7400106.1 NADH:ubiquinone reductase (Na(+)-transporting) subunit C [Chitinophagales bacterium]MBK7109046.1 NADH:ubiquinone reductase (Na(+)-transporting) subunit C [Bacteroidota bacterium]MBK8488633.1 NADH:ubiquinone reductase (Na(+)-transporting) subunit C [Bacteroidota bacterium]MBK8681606.1 NADH:ubiquinone reductase (Na(+)-transporting) subunit C [Bacteroidota bacterium]